MEDIYQNFGVPLPTKTNGSPTQPTATIIPDYPTVEHVTASGHTILWVVFALMLISTLGFIALSWRVTIQRRLFYQITTFITLISTLSYYAMATGNGWTFHHMLETNEHKHDIPDTHHLVHRQVFYARYIEWFLTTPLLLLNLSILAGLSGSNILNVVVASVVTVLTGVFATFTHGHKQKWGWYVMGWIAFLTVVWHLATHGRVNAQRRKVQGLFVPLAAYTLVIWALYPIFWAVAGGSRRWSVNHEVLAYAILDFLAKPVFGIWLLLAHRRTPASAVHIDGVWSEGLGHREGILRVGDDDEA